jgi:hypothetical protein
MTNFEHEPGCDGQHTARQGCNTNAAATAARSPEQASAPRRLTLADDSVAENAAAGSDLPVAAGEPGTSDSVAARDAPGMPGNEPPEQSFAPEPMQASDSGALADGPLETISNGGIPMLPLVGVAVAIVLSALAMWRIFRRR